MNIKFEISKVDQSKLSDEFLEFGPLACMECDFEGAIPNEYFRVTPDINSEEDYNELKKSVKEQLGYDSFNETNWDDDFFISVCRCPNCGSEEIFQDF